MHMALDPHKAFFDICLSAHQAFVCVHLKGMHWMQEFLCADCNAGMGFSHKKGHLTGLVDMWCTQNSVTNVLSMPKLERARFIVSHKTGVKWAVGTPEGKDTESKKDAEGPAVGFP